MLPLATIAETFHYSGRDRERSVRRLFARKARFLDDHMDAEELKHIYWHARKSTEKPALENAA